MASKIKLENIKIKEYDKVSGKAKAEVVTEYVCSGCRHLIEIDDIYCWCCGKKLAQSSKVEHYEKGKELSEEEFQTRRGKLKLG